MAWSHDFCLTCDNLTTDGAYCSEHCRLADFQKGQIQSSRQNSQPSVEQHARFAASRSSSPALSSHLPSTGTSTDGQQWHSTSHHYFSTSQLSPTLRQSLTAAPAALSNAPYHPLNNDAHRRVSAPHLQQTDYTISQEPSSYPSSGYASVTSETHSFPPSARSTPPSPTTSAYSTMLVGGISEAARRELRRYDDALDSARNGRRRRHGTLT